MASSDTWDEGSLGTIHKKACSGLRDRQRQDTDSLGDCRSDRSLPCDLGTLCGPVLTNGFGTIIATNPLITVIMPEARHLSYGAQGMEGRPPMSKKAGIFVVSFITLVATGCGSAQRSSAPPRSPSHDYPPPPPESPAGETMGADRTPPNDKLATSPRIGNGGFLPAAQPPHGEPRPGAGPPPPPPREKR